METRKIAYRGNHTHLYDQHTLLIRGKASYFLFMDVRKEYWLKNDEIFVTPSGVPHIMIPEEDILTFEYWEGAFEAEKVQGYFEDLTEGRIV